MLETLRPQSQVVSGLPAAPYPGLRAYSEEESLIFCGRRDHKLELLRLLESRRFLAVLGTSGSGKSSLVYAGLLPDIKKGFLVGVDPDRNILARTTPGLDPLARLTTALANAADFNKCPSPLEGGASGLASALGSGLIRMDVANAPQPFDGARPTPSSLIIYIDQFEELFGFLDDAEDSGSASSPNLSTSNYETALSQAQSYVRLLLDCTQQKTFPIYVVISMRSDFFWRCESFPGLARAVSQSQFHTPRLERRQVEEAIRKPLELYKSEIEDDLVAELLNQAPHEADQLPALQHVLFRLWHLAKARTPQDGPVVLKLDDFRNPEVGGYVSSMEQHASEVIASIASSEQVPVDEIRKDVRSIFCALASFSSRVQSGLSNSTLWVRRRLTFEKLDHFTGIGRARLQSILFAFRSPECCFLLPLSHPTSPTRQQHLKRQEIIQVSHEAIFRRWSSLVEWLGAERVRAQTLSLYLENTGSGPIPERTPSHPKDWNGYLHHVHDMLMGATELAPSWLQQRSKDYLENDPDDYGVAWGKRHSMDLPFLHRAWVENDRRIKLNLRRKFLFPVFVVFVLLACIVASTLLTKSEELKESNNKLEKSNSDLGTVNHNLELEKNNLKQANADLKVSTEKLAAETKAKSDLLAEVTIQKMDLESTKISLENTVTLLNSKMDEVVSAIVLRTSGVTLQRHQLGDAKNCGIQSLFTPVVLKKLAAAARPKDAGVAAWCRIPDPNSSTARKVDSLVYALNGEAAIQALGTLTYCPPPPAIPADASVSADRESLVYVQNHALKLLQPGRGDVSEVPLNNLLSGQKLTCAVFDPTDPLVGYVGTESGEVHSFALGPNGFTSQVLISGKAPKVPVTRLHSLDTFLAYETIPGRLAGCWNAGETIVFPSDWNLSSPCALLGKESSWLVAIQGPELVAIPLKYINSQDWDQARQSTLRLKCDGRVKQLAVNSGGDILVAGTETSDPLKGESRGKVMIWHVSALNAANDIRAGKADPTPGEAVSPGRLLPGHKGGITSILWGSRKGDFLVTVDDDALVLVWPRLWWDSQLKALRYKEPISARFSDSSNTSARLDKAALSFSEDFLAVNSNKQVGLIPLAPRLLVKASQYEVQRSDLSLRQPASAYFKGEITGTPIGPKETLSLVSWSDADPERNPSLSRLFKADPNRDMGTASQLDTDKLFIAAAWDPKFTSRALLRSTKVRVSRVRGNSTSSAIEVTTVDIVPDGIPMKASLSEGLVKKLDLKETDSVLIELPLIPTGTAAENAR